MRSSVTDSLLHRHRDSGNLHADRAQVITAGEVEGLPVASPEGQVCGGRGPVDDATELLALTVHDPDAARTATVNVALRIDLHPVGNAGLGSAQVGEHAVGVPGQGAVGQQIEGPDVTAARVVDVQDALVR